MKTRICHFLDLRNAELMRHSDSIDEKRWRARVRVNIAARVADRRDSAVATHGSDLQLLRRQAS